MATLAEIEKATKDYADAREKLSKTVRTLEDRIERLKRRYLPGIKAQVGATAARRLDLKNAIDDSPALFVKPRTIIFHGIKIGLQKGKGKIEFDKSETDRIVKLIEKHFPERSDDLIETKKAPIKKALNRLTVQELKRLGIEVDDTGDTVVIKPTDSQIEKLVDRLLKEKDEETEEEAA